MSNPPEPRDPVDLAHKQAGERDFWRTGPIWMASERTLAKYVGRPIKSFLKVESAGGILLLAAAIIAIAWANSPWSGAYETLWSTEITLHVGSFEVAEDLRHWVNDGLMAIFFFVVGLEIKYELVSGELRDPRAAMVPIAAAFGGMAVPAAIYLAWNAGGAGEPGWGIPMATDIAFAVGVLAVLGRRIPSPARVFLLTLAIVDDIGAITVIAIFYTDDLSLPWLAACGAGLLVIVGLRRIRVWSMPVYVIVGVFVWFAMFESGVHPTVAGVLIGLLTPAKPLLDEQQARQYAQDSIPDGLDADELRRYRFLLGESVSVAERLERTMHPWSSYVVLPIFALANAGIFLGDGIIADAIGSPITLGVAVGLLVGKTVGVSLASWLVIRLGPGRLPTNTGWDMMIGLAMVAGVGFTVSLFVTGLAFGDDTVEAADAKVGVFGGSLIAAGLGAAVLVAASVRRRRHFEHASAGAGGSLAHESADRPLDPEEEQSGDDGEQPDDEEVRRSVEPGGELR